MMRLLHVLFITSCAFKHAFSCSCASNPCDVCYEGTWGSTQAAATTTISISNTPNCFIPRLTILMNKVVAYNDDEDFPLHLDVQFDVDGSGSLINKAFHSDQDPYGNDNEDLEPLDEDFFDASCCCSADCLPSIGNRRRSRNLLDGPVCKCSYGFIWSSCEAPQPPSCAPSPAAIVNDYRLSDIGIIKIMSSITVSLTGSANFQTSDNFDSTIELRCSDSTFAPTQVTEQPTSLPTQPTSEPTPEPINTTLTPTMIPTHEPDALPTSMPTVATNIPSKMPTTSSISSTSGSTTTSHSEDDIKQISTSMTTIAMSQATEPRFILTSSDVSESWTTLQNGDDAARSQNSNTQNVAMIAMVVGAILLVLVIAFGGYCCCRSWKNGLNLADIKSKTDFDVHSNRGNQHTPGFIVDDLHSPTSSPKGNAETVETNIHARVGEKTGEAHDDIRPRTVSDNTEELEQQDEGVKHTGIDLVAAKTALYTQPSDVSSHDERAVAQEQALFEVTAGTSNFKDTVGAIEKSKRSTNNGE